MLRSGFLGGFHCASDFKFILNATDFVVNVPNFMHCLVVCVFIYIFWWELITISISVALHLKSEKFQLEIIDLMKNSQTSLYCCSFSRWFTQCYGFCSHPFYFFLFSLHLTFTLSNSFHFTHSLYKTLSLSI